MRKPKIHLWPGSALDSTGIAYNTLQTPTGFKGPTAKGDGRAGRGKEKVGRRGDECMGREGREGKCGGERGDGSYQYSPPLQAPTY